MPANYTKKHYKQIADELVEARKDAMQISQSPEAARLRIAGINIVERRLVRVFELDNPAFDAQRFAMWTQAQED